jgi:hypothetical protein
MDAEDIKEVEQLNRDEIEAKLPESRGDRAVIIADAMKCGAIDGHVHEEEYKALSLIVYWLGFSWDEDLKRIQAIGMSKSNYAEDIRRAFSDRTEQVAKILFDLFTKSWSDRDLMGRFAVDPRAVLVEHGIKIKAVLDDDLSRLIRNIAYGLDSTGAKRECLRSEEDRMLVEAANKQMGFVENVNESSDSEFLNECKDLAARLEI